MREDGMNYIVKLCNLIYDLCTVDTVFKYIFWAGL